MYQSAISTSSTIRSRLTIVHHGTCTVIRLAVKNGRSPFSSPPMLRSLTTNRPLSRLRRQPADAEVALEEGGAALLRLAAQPRAEVDAEEGDEHDGEDDGGGRQRETHEPPQAGEAAAGNVGRRVRGRVGQLAGGLGWIHSHTSDAGAGQATPHCSRNTTAFRPVRLTARAARPRSASRWPWP